MTQRSDLVIESDLNALLRVHKWFRSFCLRHHADALWRNSLFDKLSLAVAEGFTNAVRHAHNGLPRDTQIQIEVTLSSDRIEIRLWDHGPPFDPNTLVEPEPGTLREGGYGWFLLRRLADQVTYTRTDDQRNCLLILKYLGSTD